MDANQRAEKSVQDEISKIPLGDRIRKPETEKKSESVEEKNDTAEENEKVISEHEVDSNLIDTDEDESLDDEDDEDSDEDEDTVKISKKELQILQKRARKDEKKDQQIEELRKMVGKTDNKISNDDLVDKLKDKLGLADKAGVSELIEIMSELTDRKLKGLQEKIDRDEAEKKVESAAKKYDAEFQAIGPRMKKALGISNDTDFKKVTDLMNELAHTPGVGGKAYTDPITGKKLLDPYSLNEIFMNNIDKFEEVLDGKKVKGMEIGRTREATHRETVNTSDGSQPLTKNASGSEIMARDKAIREQESKRDVLRDGGNNRI